MNLSLLIILLAACGVLMIFERRGLKTTLALKFKGDIKRESRFLAQYGQALCTAIVAVLIWQLDARRQKIVVPLVVNVAATTVIATLIKRLLSRVRPGRENAGKFLGPFWSHANYRESFPSSHSASAVALSVFLAILYPPAAPTFWALALGCATLRYLLDAHWPSDVLAGVALGYATAHAIARLFHVA
jgi:membrane-associated phospholipid phosphatase